MFIAEVKTKTPFGWESEYSWDSLFEIANEHGDMVSVHTNPLWGGSFELLERACKMTDKPVLAKGIHSTEEDVCRSLDAGAADVLVVGWIPWDYLCFCIVEPYDYQQLKNIPEDVRVMWNQRNLKHGNPKHEGFERVRNSFGGWLGQASFIWDKSQVHPKADAYMVGTHLKKFCGYGN